MSNATVVRSFRAFCLVLALALFAPLIAATPAHAAIVSFNCAAGGGTYQVSDGTLTGTTGTCTGDLVLDNSVTTISYLSLYQTQITSLTIPASVLTVTNPFYYNKALVSVNVDSASTTFKSIDGVLFNFAGTSLISYPAAKPGTTYTIPSSVTSMGIYAFTANKYLTSISIPNGVTTTSFGIFHSSEALTTVNIGSGLMEIDGNIFSYMRALAAINVDVANTSFASIDGVLYNKNISKILVYPPKKAGTSFTPPSTVTATETAAFGSTTNLLTVDLSSVTTLSRAEFDESTSIQEVTLGNSLTALSSAMFQSASGLRKITLGTALTSIGSNAFWQNSSLSCVVYTGTNSTIQNYAYPNGVTPVASGSSCLTAPAFTLSSSSEVVTVGSGIKGYTINSTGGAIASFEISPTISNTPGLVFSSQTGFISETPTATAALRAYTITARNTVGTASQTFSVTVNPAPREVTCGEGTYTVNLGIASAGTDCTGALVIASDVTEIATRAFQEALITSLTLPSSLTTIRYAGFYGLPYIQSLVIPNSVTLIENQAFEQGQYTSLTLGSGVTGIGDQVFYRNYGARINSITFGAGLTSIGYAAFQNFGVDRLTIPEGVTTLASRAFDAISSTVLVLPNSLTSIASDSFVYGNFTIVKYCGSNAAVTSYAFNVPIACGAIVDFNANTGSGTMSPSISSSNSALPTNTFTRSGYNFNGWNTNSSGTGTSYAAGATFPYTTASNTTLYATWVPSAPSAPAFTITSATENATAASAISGFAINSTGGAISSFSISPSIDNGLSFNFTTGLISGTPTNSASSKVYTITATNASGTASATYTIQVAQSAAQIAAAAEAAAAKAEAKVETKRVADAAAEAKRVADAAAEAKRVADAATEAKRVADVAAEAKRVTDAATEAKRVADAATEAKRVADAATEAKRVADVAAEAKRVADVAKEAKRVADAAIGAKRASDVTNKEKAQAQLDAQRALLTGTKKVSTIKKTAPKKADVKLINLKPGTKIKITIKVGKK